MASDLMSAAEMAAAGLCQYGEHDHAIAWVPVTHEVTVVDGEQAYIFRACESCAMSYAQSLRIRVELIDDARARRSEDDTRDVPV